MDTKTENKKAEGIPIRWACSECRTKLKDKSEMVEVMADDKEWCYLGCPACGAPMVRIARASLGTLDKEGDKNECR